MSKNLDYLEPTLNRLAHLAGYTAFLYRTATQLTLTAIAIEGLHIEGDNLLTLAETLKTEAEGLATLAGEAETELTNAIGRLSDNPTDADITAALESMGRAKTSLGNIKTGAANIDPSQPTEGGINEGDLPAEGGEVTA